MRNPKVFLKKNVIKKETIVENKTKSKIVFRRKMDIPLSLLFFCWNTLWNLVIFYFYWVANLFIKIVSYS